MTTSPTPIRLTRQRAEALVAAATIGLDIMDAQVRRRLNAADSADDMAAVKTSDLERARGLDALAIVKARYLHGEEPTEAAPTLFTID